VSGFFSVWQNFQRLAIFSVSGFFSIWQFFQRLAFWKKLAELLNVFFNVPYPNLLLKDWSISPIMPYWESFFQKVLTATHLKKARSRQLHLIFFPLLDELSLRVDL
jgi:hypothetical protein